jgi:hypothetical protein
LQTRFVDVVCENWIKKLADRKCQLLGAFVKKIICAICVFVSLPWTSFAEAPRQVGEFSIAELDQCLALAEANGNVSSGVCRDVFRDLTPKVDEWLFSKGRRTNPCERSGSNGSENLIPLSMPLEKSNRLKINLCITAETLPALMAATAPYSYLRNKAEVIVPREFRTGDYVSTIIIFSLFDAMIYSNGRPENLMLLASRIGVSVATATNVVVALAVASSFGTGYYTGKLIVKADRVYLNGWIVDRSSRLIEGSIDGVYDVTNQIFTKSVTSASGQSAAKPKVSLSRILN